jgi:hypothetical protein|tara:strand:+ start:250 stop:516 length:267 start_codon:yes stop_codon:yes gene_type:complete
MAEKNAKITDEQLKSITENQGEIDKLITTIGILESQKHGALHEIGTLNEALNKDKVELEKEYGPININLKTGEYTIIEPKEIEEKDKK